MDARTELRRALQEIDLLKALLTDIDRQPEISKVGLNVILTRLQAVYDTIWVLSCNLPVQVMGMESGEVSVAAVPPVVTFRQEVKPEPAVVPDPVSEPDPVAEPEPITFLTPEPEPEPEPVAEPVAEPEVEPEAEPEAEPVADPEVEPDVEPAVEFEAEPVAEPAPFSPLSDADAEELSDDALDFRVIDRSEWEAFPSSPESDIQDDPKPSVPWIEPEPDTDIETPPADTAPSIGAFELVKRLFRGRDSREEKTEQEDIRWPSAAEMASVQPRSAVPPVTDSQKPEPPVAEERAPEPQPAEPVLQAAPAFQAKPVAPEAEFLQPEREEPLTRPVAPKIDTLADKLTQNKEAKSLHETLATASDEGSVPAAPLRDIFDGIGLNDRFLFIRELFRSNPRYFNHTVEILNKAPDLHTAVRFLQKEFDWWDLEQETTRKFLQLVERRHMKV